MLALCRCGHKPARRSPKNLQAEACIPELRKPRLALRLSDLSDSSELSDSSDQSEFLRTATLHDVSLTIPAVCG